MTNPMIERVAIALHRADGDRVKKPGENWRPATWHDVEEDLRAIYRDHARAAIEAMRDPTEAMAVAGSFSDHTLEGMGDDYPSAEQSCINIFNAMIAAALDEGSS